MSLRPSPKDLAALCFGGLRGVFPLGEVLKEYFLDKGYSSFIKKIKAFHS
jgi:hypothetical protein